MVVVTSLVWDEWNRKHVAEHCLTTEEVEEACHSKHEAIKSFRKRIQIAGETINGRKLLIILSPEDRNGKVYGKDTYYVITAYIE